jgi:hypothetical protein
VSSYPRKFVATDFPHLHVSFEDKGYQSSSLIQIKERRKEIEEEKERQQERKERRRKDKKKTQRREHPPSHPHPTSPKI